MGLEDEHSLALRVEDVSGGDNRWGKTRTGDNMPFAKRLQRWRDDLGICAMISCLIKKPESSASGKWGGLSAGGLLVVLAHTR